MNLGSAHLLAGHTDEAEVWDLRAMAIAQRMDAGKPLTADLGRHMVNLASLYSKQGKPELAIPVIEKAVDALRSTLGETHADVIHAQVVQQHVVRQLRERP